MIVKTKYATIDREELEQLQKDAERYRWLIDNAEEIYIPGANGFGMNLHLDTYYLGRDKVHSDVDAYIDASMAAMQA